MQSQAMIGSDLGRRHALRLLAGTAGSLMTLGCGTTAATPSAVNASRALSAGRDFSAVGQVAQDAIGKSIIPGAVTMIGGRDGVLYSDVRGDGHKEADVRLQANSLFRIYSMTKPVTSVAALILHEAGLLDLDAPVSNFIPGFARSMVYAGGDSLETLQLVAPVRAVTVRDLMRHTAGLTYRSGDTPIGRLYVWRGIDNGSGENFTAMDGSTQPEDLASFAEKIATLPLLNQPGARFTYGNATDVLGRVVEAISGQRLGAFMQARIFAPLGMTQTAFQAVDRARLTAAYFGIAAPRTRNEIIDSTDVSSLGEGQLRLVDPPATSPFARPRPIDFGGAGLVATAGDYLTFARMLALGGAVDGTRVLSEQSVRLMSTNALGAEALEAPGLKSAGLGFGLGAGVYVDPSKTPAGIPPSVFFWGGAASTFFWADPTNGIGGTIMTQVFGGDFRAYQIAMIQAFYRALG